MNIYIEDDMEGISQRVTMEVLRHMSSPKRVNIALDGGSTTYGFFEKLSAILKQIPVYDHVHYYNMDEFRAKGQTEGGKQLEHLTKKFYIPASIPKNRIHHLNEYNYRTFDEEVEKDGGFDLVMLGIGEDGHLAANLPGTGHFGDKTRSVPVVGDFVDMMAEFMGGKDKVPDHYVTGGIKTIMNAKHIILMACGEKKAEIIKKAFHGPVTEDVPASALQLHPNLTVVIDKKSGKFL